VHENIGRLRTTGEKTKSAYAIEPLYMGLFPVALSGDHDMCLLRQLRWADRCRLVDGEDADGVQTFWRLNRFADDSGTLVGRLEIGASKAGNMDENVG
jgi:hypothetical protein